MSPSPSDERSRFAAALRVLFPWPMVEYTAMYRPVRAYVGTSDGSLFGTFADPVVAHSVAEAVEAFTGSPASVTRQRPA